MAITTDSYGSVATPRIYIDYGLYIQTIGYVKKYTVVNAIEKAGTNARDIFSLNPSKTSTFEIDDNLDQSPYIRMRFKNYDEGELAGFQVRHFLTTINYAAFLGHNIGFLGEGRFLDVGVRGGYSHQDEDVVGHSKGRNQVGYNIYTIKAIDYTNYPDGAPLDRQDALSFIVNQHNEPWSGVEPYFEIGAFSTGRYFDFPYSPDLDVSISVTYPGVKTIRTQGGSDLRSVDYYRNDKWGSFAPWTYIDLDYYNYNGISSLESKIKEDYSKVSNIGKRVFKVNYSYLDKTNIFPMNFENNMAGYWDSSTLQFNSNNYDADVDGTHKDNLIGNFLTFTLGGQLQFIFQPDNTKQDFAICKLDKPSLDIKQEANGVYSISMTFREV